ncbi:MAG TPA: M48 family metallopeptidase [Ardenticatenaceae bacterium]|nr:M48 family metallopeptidase [Ardenticatenaceae bacterium]
MVLAAVALLVLAGRGGEAALAGGDRLDQARALRAIRDRNFFLGLVWSWGFLLLLLNAGASAWLHTRISRRLVPRWLSDSVYFALLLLAVEVVAWPLRYRAEYQVARRFGLNIQTPPAWLWDQVLTAAINVAIGVVAVLVLYGLMRRFPRRWLLIAAVLGIGASIGGSFLWPVVIDPLYNEYRPVTNPEILARVEHLSRVTGVPIGAVLRVDMGRRTTAANAWVTGLWGTRRIVIGDTLLERYSPAEIEAVLAHELGHVVHHDVWWGTVALAAAQAAALFVQARPARWLLRLYGGRWRISGLADPAGLPLLLLLLGVAFTVAMPAVNAASRWREAAADRYALKVTSEPAALESFFEAVGRQNLQDPNPPHWHVWLFMSHPPLAERIEMVRRASQQ